MHSAPSAILSRFPQAALRLDYRPEALTLPGSRPGSQGETASYALFLTLARMCVNLDRESKGRPLDTDGPIIGRLPT